MGRYMHKYKDNFTDKTVFELGSGTGVAGLAILKQAQVAHIGFSDNV